MDFDLHQYGHFSIQDLNTMFPFEKEIYISMLIDKIKKENEAIKNSRQGR